MSELITNYPEGEITFNENISPDLSWAQSYIAENLDFGTKFWTHTPKNRTRDIYYSNEINGRSIIAKLNTRKNLDTANKELFYSTNVNKSEYRTTNAEYTNSGLTYSITVSIENIIAARTIPSSDDPTKSLSITYSEAYEGYNTMSLLGQNFRINTTGVSINGLLSTEYSKYTSNLRYHLGFLFPSDQHGLDQCIFNYSLKENNRISINLIVLDLEHIVQIPPGRSTNEVGFLLR